MCHDRPMTGASSQKQCPEECGVGEWFHAAAHPAFGAGFLEYEWHPPGGNEIRVFRRIRFSIQGRLERIWYRYF